MPRYHSEESLPSKMGLYSSRIHSSADEISSINRSPSELSSSDESFSRTDFSRDEDGESPSPPSRPRSHAPWIYPSDIQIDPSSLEVSPKLQHMEFPDGNANESDNDPLRDLRMPSIGPSPSTFNSERETSHEPDEEPDDDQDDDQDHDQDLRSRLNLPPGVTGAESCRSASPGDFQLFVYSRVSNSSGCTHLFFRGFSLTHDLIGYLHDFQNSSLPRKNFAFGSIWKTFFNKKCKLWAFYSFA